MSTSANEKAGQSGRKSVKKRELVFSPSARGTTGTVVHLLDATQILPELR